MFKCCRPNNVIRHILTRHSSGLSYTKHSSHVKDVCHVPILFLHGVFGSKMNFNKQAKRLASDLQTDCYCIDCRNHGMSEWRETMSLSELAEDISNFAQKEGLEKVCIVGHSLGGKQACLVCSMFPQLVQAAVIVDIFPVPFASTHLDNVCTALSLIPLSKLQSREQASQLLASQIPSEAERSFILSNLIAIKGKGVNWRWRCNLKVISDCVYDIRGYPPQTPVSHTDTLFLYGGNSDYMSSERIAHTRTLFSAAQFEGIEGAGHIVHLDQPELFRTAVKRFLLKHGALKDNCTSNTDTY